MQGICYYAPSERRIHQHTEQTTPEYAAKMILAAELLPEQSVEIIALEGESFICFSTCCDNHCFCDHRNYYWEEDLGYGRYRRFSLGRLKLCWNTPRTVPVMDGNVAILVTSSIGDTSDLYGFCRKMESGVERAIERFDHPPIALVFLGV